MSEDRFKSRKQAARFKGHKKDKPYTGNGYQGKSKPQDRKAA